MEHGLTVESQTGGTDCTMADSGRQSSQAIGAQLPSRKRQGIAGFQTEDVLQEPDTPKSEALGIFIFGTIHRHREGDLKTYTMAAVQFNLSGELFHQKIY